MGRRILLVVLTILAGTSAAASASDPLTLAVHPRVMRAGGHASVRLRVEPDPRSRSMEISWWSETGVGGSHRRDVAGDRDAIRHEFPLKYLDAGTYEVTVVITRNDGSKVRRATSILVMP